jgi:hypothetical protein
MPSFNTVNINVTLSASAFNPSTMDSKAQVDNLQSWTQSYFPVAGLNEAFSTGLLPPVYLQKRNIISSAPNADKSW